ncbi:MAG TPA: CBS domain-containing protein [Euryarchaeota archaeon]|nr:inosine 5'-monophosphate dehydrogenase [archaeon BMS3Bbin15]HDL16051.1 CBS domain-containing protein [Euryarchaeota archaeon]
MEIVLEDKKVKDVMTVEVISVNISHPISKVISILSTRDVSGVVVVDNVGDVVGIISAMDIFKLFDGDKKVKLNYYAEDVMTPYTITIMPGADLYEAGRLMLENGIHRLVVTESPLRKRPIGIISSTDIIKEIKNLI